MDTVAVAENPYRSPTIAEVAISPFSDIREVREEHLNHEASIKAIGLLCILGGVLLAGSFAFFGIETVAAGTLESSSAMMMVFQIAFATLLLISGIGLRQLQEWARLPAASVAAVSMVFVPIGTIFGIYILYLIFTPKGSRVLSAEYREVGALTPDLHYQTPRWFWICMVVVTLLLAGFAAFVLSAA